MTGSWCTGVTLQVGLKSYLLYNRLFYCLIQMDSFIISYCKGCLYGCMPNFHLFSTFLKVNQTFINISVYACFHFQIWDFNSAQKIKDVPPEPLNNTMVYCCQWLGTDSIICGGHNHNMARVIDRGTLNVRYCHGFYLRTEMWSAIYTVRSLVEKLLWVWCIDSLQNDVGSSKDRYLLKTSLKPSLNNQHVLVM